MIALLPESVRYPLVSLPETVPSDAPSCASCEAYRPLPQPDGNLPVDPEIYLRSPGIDVDVDYFYNALETGTERECN
jgi:hypothetical protein